MTPEQQIREALDYLWSYAGGPSIEAEGQRADAQAALVRLVAERDEARQDRLEAIRLEQGLRKALGAAEGREAALREALNFVLAATGAELPEDLRVAVEVP